MPLVNFTDLTTTTTAAQISAMNVYLAYPLVSLTFGVVVVIASIYAIVRLVFWLGHKIANLTKSNHDGMTQQW